MWIVVKNIIGSFVDKHLDCLSRSKQTAIAEILITGCCLRTSRDTDFRLHEFNVKLKYPKAFYSLAEAIFAFVLFQMRSSWQQSHFRKLKLKIALYCPPPCVLPVSFLLYRGGEIWVPS